MKVLVKNKKATFNYEVLNEFDAGIVLTGFEAKSVRAGHAKLEGAHVVVRGGEAFLVGASISPYQPTNTPAHYDPQRTRKLLLTKKELDTLIGVDATKGLTLIPLMFYTSSRFIKIRIASVRGKKKYDKREAIKERDSKRDIAMIMKQNHRL